MEATRRGQPIGLGRIDRRRVEATSDADIRRHMIEDGLDPDNPLVGFRPVVSAATIRARVGMSQASFARALRIPLATLRNWEQERTPPDPAARALLTLVAADPAGALEVLSQRSERGSASPLGTTGRKRRHSGSAGGQAVEPAPLPQEPRSGRGTRSVKS